MDCSDNCLVIGDWQTRTEKLNQRSRHLLETGVWSDCKFVVGGDINQREYYAHKLILSMSSPVFATMFNTGFQETDTADVKILDVQPDAFGTLLKYIYTDELNISSFDQACELCYVANKYMMPFLVKRCSSYIWKDVTYNNVCRAYEFSNLFDQESLQKKCVQIICTETEEVLRHASFMDVELSTLNMILDQDELFISDEIQLYHAIIFWAAQEFNRRGIVGDDYIKEQRELTLPLFSKIRFLLMTAEEFALGPAKSPLLTQDQKYAILINISSSESGVPMPQGFSVEVRHRNYQVKHKTSHFLCRLDLVRDKPVLNIGLMESSIIFSCNRDIKIHGVQMMAQTSKQPSVNQNYSRRASSDRYSTYRESMYIHLEEVVQDEGVNGWLPISGKIENTTYKNVVTYGEVMELTFQKPGRVSKGRYYKLAIGLNIPGSYIKWILKTTSAVAHTCLFHFYPSDYPLDNGLFFQAIIFTI